MKTNEEDFLLNTLTNLDLLKDILNELVYISDTLELIRREISMSEDKGTHTDMRPS